MYWVEEADALKVLNMTQLKKAVLKRQKDGMASMSARPSDE
jgi:hypothetical protein